MGTIRNVALACALLVVPVTAASAADLPAPPPMEVPFVPPPACCVSPWYLKGYLGMTSYEVDKIIPTEFAPDADFEIIHKGFEASSFFGIGIGYIWSDKFRFDVTSEYRNRATFHGLDRFDDDGDDDFDGTNEYTATLKSWVTLFNAYWDIYRWNVGCCNAAITPYVGGGIGYALNWIGNYSDVNVPSGAVYFGTTERESNLAWALHAGLAIDVTKNVTIDLAYRYLNIGDATSGPGVAYTDSSEIGALDFDDVFSHDLLLGVRWRFGGSPAPMPISWK